MAPWRLRAAAGFLFARAIVGNRIVEDGLTARLEQDAAGWDLRAKLEEKVLKFLRENRIAVGPDSTVYPGKVEVSLCDTRENKRSSDVTFELNNSKTVKEDFQSQMADKWWGDYQLWDNTSSPMDIASVIEPGQYSEDQFPLTCMAVGRRPFTVKCASTVTNEDTIGLAISGLQICLKVDFENFDLTSLAPFLFLHGSMAVRITMPLARLGFFWDAAKGGPSGFFNEKDASRFEFDMLSWRAEESSVGEISPSQRKFSSAALSIAKFLDEISIPGMPKNVQVLDVVMQKIDVFGIIARRIASKIDAFSSTIGAKSVTSMLTSSTVQRTANNFAWYTGYGAGSCSSPKGSVDQDN